MGATAAFYFVEGGALGKDLRSRSLRSQARELLASMRPSGSGAVAFDLPADWAEAYARPGSTVFYTLYDAAGRSEEHPSDLQSLIHISYAVFCLGKKTDHKY